MSSLCFRACRRLAVGAKRSACRLRVVWTEILWIVGPEVTAPLVSKEEKPPSHCCMLSSHLHPCLHMSWVSKPHPMVMLARVQALSNRQLGVVQVFFHLVRQRAAILARFCSIRPDGG